jgi:hypothetical protein
VAEHDSRGIKRKFKASVVEVDWYGRACRSS